jgi:hypothetical protein
MRRVSIVNNNYTILVSSAQTAGRHCLIDMLVPDGGGPASAARRKSMGIPVLRTAIVRPAREVVLGTRPRDRPSSESESRRDRAQQPRTGREERP